MAHKEGLKFFNMDQDMIGGTSCILPRALHSKHACLGPINNRCNMKCLIRKHPLFLHVSNFDFDMLLEKSKYVELSPHETLFHQGKEAKRFYIVIEGSVKLYRIFENGQESIIGNISLMQAVGEYDIFTKSGCYKYFAETSAPTQLVSFPAQQYLNLIHGSNAAACSMIEYLAEKNSSHYSEIETISICNSRQRVVSYLNKIYQCRDKDLSDSESVTLPAPKYQIAAYLGMKPETFSRVLNSLQKEKLICVDKRNIKIIDTDMLNPGKK